MPLADLHALRVEAKKAVEVLDNAKEFRRMSGLASSMHEDRISCRCRRPRKRSRTVIQRVTNRGLPTDAGHDPGTWSKMSARAAPELQK
jgi:hypothetical protein